MTPILPVPADAPKLPDTYGGRRYSRLWVYRDAEGRILLYIYRFDEPGGGKQIRPLIYAVDAETGKPGWHWKALPEPRPLYGLDRLAAGPAAPVLICEGEKAASAARKLCPGWVCMTSPNGAQSARKADWKPLAGRRVAIWRDNDDAGERYATDVAQLVTAAGATSVEMVDLAQITAIRQKGGRAGDLPSGWDAADAAEEGWVQPGLLDDESLLLAWKPPAATTTEAEWTRPDDMPEDALLIDPTAPYRTAGQLIGAHFRNDAGKRILQRWSGAWYRWQDTHYEEVAPDVLRAQVYRDLSACWKPCNDTAEPVEPNKRMVDAVVDALAARCTRTVARMPTWLGHAQEGRPKARRVVAFQNGLLNLGDPDAVRAGRLLPHTPLWFSTAVLPYDYDPEATCPTWSAFVAGIAGRDATWVPALQRWMGYLLTADTSQQKIAVLHGPPRSGKGTILRVLTAMLGEANVGSPAIADLGSTFGLQPLVGKTVALCGEAHLGRTANRAAILEVLKKISGEDAVDINRKFLPALTGQRLPVRFVLAVNELLNLPDPSGALADRMHIFPFTTSYTGREDTTLDKRLRRELPGICRWALEGALALRAGERLVAPASGAAVLAEVRRLASPVQAWLEDWCEVGAKLSILCGDAYEAWCNYCEQHGHEAGSAASFGVRLNAANRSVTRVRVGPKDARHYVYQGITLSSHADRAMAVAAANQDRSLRFRRPRHQSNP